jgi:hypothetical protein
MSRRNTHRGAQSIALSTAPAPTTSSSSATFAQDACQPKPCRIVDASSAARATIVARLPHLSP